MEDPSVLARRLILAATRMDGAYYYFARHSGVPENQLALFYALSDGKPHSQKEICEDWLIPKTTINTVVKEQVAAGHLTLRAGEGRGGRELPELSPDSPDPSPGPEELMLRKERLRRLREVIDGLGGMERELLYRKYYYLQSTAQMAAELGLTPRGVEGRLHRLRRRLRKELGGELDG